MECERRPERAGQAPRGNMSPRSLFLKFSDNLAVSPSHVETRLMDEEPLGQNWRRGQHGAHFYVSPLPSPPHTLHLSSDRGVTGGAEK